jgi:hypothetical protein
VIGQLLTGYISKQRQARNQAPTIKIHRAEVVGGWLASATAHRISSDAAYPSTLLSPVCEELGTGIALCPDPERS